MTEIGQANFAQLGTIYTHLPSWPPVSLMVRGFFLELAGIETSAGMRMGSSSFHSNSSSSPSS
jgi:hypothetical protein